LDYIPVIFSRSGYLNSSFFINFTDPRKILFTEKFFQYKANLSEFSKYIDLSKCFAFNGKNYYLNKTYKLFYANLFLAFSFLYKGTLLYKLKAYNDAYKESLRVFSFFNGATGEGNGLFSPLNKNFDCLGLLDLAPGPSPSENF